MRVVCFRVGLMIFVASLAAGAQAPPVEIDTLGPQVGARVPDFAGADQRGRAQTLASVMGEQGAMLVFFRSADW